MLVYNTHTRLSALVSFSSRLPHPHPYPSLRPHPRCYQVSTAMSFKRKDPPTAASDGAKKAKKSTDLTSFFGPPKVASPNGTQPASLTNRAAAAVDPPPLKFDKEKWVASLTAEQKKLLKLEIDTLDPSWLGQLKDEVTSPGFLELKRFLQKEIDAKQKIYPPLQDVYSW